MKPWTIRCFRGAFGLALTVALGVGCARARVENVERAEARTLPRPARVVVFDFATGAADVRVFSSPVRTARRAAGLSVEETAEVLEVSPRTVKLDWQMARSFLRRALSAG